MQNEHAAGPYKERSRHLVDGPLGLTTCVYVYGRHTFMRIQQHESFADNIFMSRKAPRFSQASEGGKRGVTLLQRGGGRKHRHFSVGNYINIEDRQSVWLLLNI